MQWPFENRKVRNLTVIVLFLISSVVVIILTHYESPEEKAIREWVGAPKRTPWPIYVALAAVWCTVYIFLFKVEERRRRYTALSFGVVGFLCLALLPDFWWRGFIGLAVMLAIVLIGWLYPARNTDRGQV